MAKSAKTLDAIMKKGAPALGALFGMTQSEDADAGIFGAGAKMADRMMLEIAQKMSQEGHHIDEIFEKTRWFFDPEDNNWKFEAPNKDVGFKDVPVKSGDNRLGNVYQDENLFANYPELADYTYLDMPYETPANRLGDFDPGTKTVRANPNASSRSKRRTMIHEMSGHAVQDAEGWQSGASPDWFYKEPYHKALASLNSTKLKLESKKEAMATYKRAMLKDPSNNYMTRLHQNTMDETFDLMNKRDDLVKDVKHLDPDEAYSSSLGEVDATNAEWRDGIESILGEKALKKNHPLTTRAYGDYNADSKGPILKNPEQHPSYKWNNKGTTDKPKYSMADIAAKAGSPFKNDASPYTNPTLGKAVEWANNNKTLLGGPWEIFYPQGTADWLGKLAKGKKPNWQDRVDVGMDWAL